MVNRVRAILTVVIFLALTDASCQEDPTGQQTTSGWVVDKNEEALRGKIYDRFVLAGRYLTPPDVRTEGVPKLVVRCEKGKFRSGYLGFGGVVDRERHGTVFIEMRFDDRKDTDGGTLQIDTRGTAGFFNDVMLVKFMTEKLLGHPSKSENLVRRLIIGTTEAFGGEIVMQFDMPSDHSEIIDACGLEWSWRGKRKH